MKLIKAALPTAVMLIASASCTLDEPSYPDGAASQMRLSSVSSYGVTLMKWEYDKQNRVTEINVGRDMIYRFTYTGNSEIPSTISGESYDYYYDYETDKDVRYKNGEWEWTEIKADSHGHITQYNCDETDFSIDHEPSNTVSVVKFTYDSNGQLTRMEDTYYDYLQNRVVTDVDNYTWSNGLLLQRKEVSDDSHLLTNLCEYSDLDNPNRQWDPNNAILGPMGTTGFFGVGPKKFPSRIQTDNGNYYTETIQYAYTLLPNGLIRMSKVKDGDDITVVMTYTYEKL
ncbi:MAG: hypothetical protein K2H33_07940 [Muribaculaceae bacterium]|nr:hypothetical protein [Muribaculaceae bacterium]